jgi:hypothetical protein
MTYFVTVVFLDVFLYFHITDFVYGDAANMRSIPVRCTLSYFLFV